MQGPAGAGDAQFVPQGAFGVLVGLGHEVRRALAADLEVLDLAKVAAQALASFENVKRRMEVRGTVAGVTVYDDFAHHPTAITTTVDGLRRRVGQSRILAVLEPRSNTMKLGIMKAQLPNSLEAADKIFAYGASTGKDSLGWNLSEVLAPLNAKSDNRAAAFDDLSALVKAVANEAKPGDHILVMSNGGFGGVHQKILTAIQEKAK